MVKINIMEKLIKMKIGIGKFYNRRNEKSQKHDSYFIYVPAEVARDGTFPFSAGDKIRVTIEDSFVKLEKAI